MITIIVDLRRLNTSTMGALRADSVDDYAQLRRRIRQALDQQADLSVYVTSPVLRHALEDLRGYRDSVTWHNVDPAAIFEQIFRQPPTPPFSTEILAALDLDQLPNPGEPVDPLSWVLRKRLDPLWGYPAPPDGHEREVIMWAAQSDDLPNAIAILLAAQLTGWSEECIVYTALRSTHLRADAQSLLVRAALRHYDSTWVRRQPWGSLPLVDLNELEDTAAEALHTLEHTRADYWKHRYAASDRASEVIDLALDQVSGLSIVELDQLDAMLSEHPSRLVPMLFDQITQRFHRSVFTAALDRLQRRMAPPEPALPDQTWDDAMWLRWGTHNYMPYFAWVIRNGVARDHQRACALHFSDWRHQRYPTWLNSDASPVLIRQSRELRDLLDVDSEAVVLWLIIDGLTWWQGAILLDACRSQGLHPQTYEPDIAVLPSIMSTSKRALITGLRRLTWKRDPSSSAPLHSSQP